MTGIFNSFPITLRKSSKDFKRILSASWPNTIVYLLKEEEIEEEIEEMEEEIEEEIEEDEEEEEAEEEEKETETEEEKFIRSFKKRNIS